MPPREREDFCDYFCLVINYFLVELLFLSLSLTVIEIFPVGE
jgi:hypothetical protein